VLGVQTKLSNVTLPHLLGTLKGIISSIDGPYTSQSTKYPITRIGINTQKIIIRKSDKEEENRKDPTIRIRGGGGEGRVTKEKEEKIES